MRERADEQSGTDAEGRVVPGYQGPEDGLSPGPLRTTQLLAESDRSVFHDRVLDHFSRDARCNRGALDDWIWVRERQARAVLPGGLCVIRDHGGVLHRP